MVDISSTHPQHFWYFVGLIAADGCLSTDRSNINLTSKDREHLGLVKRTLQIPNRIGRKLSGAGRISYAIQMRNRDLYRFLLEVGLTPRKSLTLGSLRIPMSYFPEFLRGVIDGDGCIRTWIHSHNGKRQWALQITSASPAFSWWLKSMIEEVFCVRGRLHVREQAQRHPVYIVKFGKLAAQVILRACYHPGCLAMTRKLALAQRCVQTPNRVRYYGNVLAGVAEQLTRRT